MDARKEFYARAEAEYDYAAAKHPGWPNDVIHGSAILNEEAGKLTQACIDAVYSGGLDAESLEKMRKYAARVAAMALRFDEDLQQLEAFWGEAAQRLEAAKAGANNE